jgi:hypothetical protein
MDVLQIQRKLRRLSLSSVGFDQVYFSCHILEAVGATFVAVGDPNAVIAVAWAVDQENRCLSISDADNAAGPGPAEELNRSEAGSNRVRSDLDWTLCPDGILAYRVSHLISLGLPQP